MVLCAVTEMACYEMPLSSTLAPRAKKAERKRAPSLTEPLLISNALWFCQLRWIIIGVLALFGALGLVPGFFELMGLQSHRAWPFAAAALLVVENVGFLANARALATSPDRAGARLNLWGQIVVDMMVLTVVVHFVGSLETFVSFAYLFHIVLACIFFSRVESLPVTVMASAFYALSVWAEVSGLLPPAGLLKDRTLREHIESAPAGPFIVVFSSLGVWWVVWYLTSHLSRMVQQRDNELAETNRRLERAQEEKMRHMLRTVHQLKAPFAAIHANAQLLLDGYCGALSEQAVMVSRRITERCRRLAAEIQEMLQLANLSASDDEQPGWTELDIAEILKWCIAQVQPIAQERKVTIENDLQTASVRAVEDQMKMLFSNVLSNAVNYSYQGGRVRVECRSTPTEGVAVTVRDAGIGIPAEKLPHIFDEYYRTDEAVAHNRESTGLGLAIVRHVAERHGIKVVVESSPGIGTRFLLRFPATAKLDLPGGARRR